MLGSLRYLTIFIMAFISPSDMISVVVSEPEFPDSKNFLRIPGPAPDTAASYPSGINTLLANSVSIFFIKWSKSFS